VEVGRACPSLRAVGTRLDRAVSGGHNAVYHVGLEEALGLQVVHEGDPVIAMKKGVNFLDRKSQVHATGRVEELLDFTRPPARRKRAAPVGSGGL
jgi:hypothetical protein